MWHEKLINDVLSKQEAVKMKMQSWSTSVFYNYTAGFVNLPSLSNHNIVICSLSAY